MHFDFTLTLSSLATSLSVLLSAWAILRGLRKLQEGFSVTHWQHRVMWWHFQREKPVPDYPNMPREGPRHHG